MRRLTTLWLAISIAMAVFAFRAFVLPNPVAACSCVNEPAPLVELAQEHGVTIALGTLGQPQPAQRPLVIHTWFLGDFPADVIWLIGGSEAINSCDPGQVAGETWLMMLEGGPRVEGADPRYRTKPCSLSARVDTPEGQQLVAAAIAMFGEGRPPRDEETPAASIDVEPWLVGLPIIAGISALALVYLGIVAFIAKRRRT